MSEPDAYGLLDEGEVHYATPFRDEAERVLRRTEDKDSVIVPLYRSPTLTDAEREAIRRLLHWVHDRPCSELPVDVETDHSIACEAFERLGGGG